MYMNNRYVETTFLYLVGLSLLIHTGFLAALVYMPAREEHRPVQEPMMIDLQDLPNVVPPQITPPKNKPATRHAERPQRVERQTAPRGMHSEDKGPVPSAAPRQVMTSQPSPPEVQRPSVASPVPRTDLPTRRPEVAPRQSSPSSDVFKPTGRQSQQAAPQLFPTGKRLAQLEESFRKKYSADVEEGDTRFLDTDDLLFSGFLRRFETAVYGVWRYPNEAAKLGIEGITPVRITFNKKGEVQEVKLLQSSGSKILDDEVMRALRTVGVIGPLPRTYDKEQFHLIAFFEYGIVRGASRSIR